MALAAVDTRLLHPSPKRKQGYAGSVTPRARNSRFPRLRFGLGWKGTRAGSPNTEASCIHEKHDIVSFFLGKRSLLVLPGRFQLRCRRHSGHFQPAAFGPKLT